MRSTSPQPKLAASPSKPIREVSEQPPAEQVRDDHRPVAQRTGSANRAASKPAGVEPEVEKPHPSTAALVRDLNLLKDELATAEAPSLPARVDTTLAARRSATTRQPDPVPAQPEINVEADLPYRILVHLFADAPQERLVVIDGKRLREGDELDDKYRITSITKTGVRLSDGQSEFELNVRSR